MAAKLNLLKLLQLLIIILVVPTFSLEVEDYSFDDLDLSELMNLDADVTVATKNSVKSSDAPGTIISYSSTDMKNLGYYTIRDLSNITTGYSPYYSIGEITLETRGQKSPGFDNNKHLLLVNGIPFRHLRAGKIPVEEDFTLFGSKRVEFMKGPVSALYGTGAFSGVINIIGDTLYNDGISAKGRAALSSDNISKDFQGSIYSRKGNNQFSVTVGIFDKETQGSPTRIRNGDMVTDSVEGYENWDDRSAISLNMIYKHTNGINVGFLYSRKESGMGEFWWMKSSQLNDITWEIMIPYVKFEKAITDMFSIKSYVLGNQSSEKVFQDPEYRESIINHYDSDADSLYPPTTAGWVGTYERKMIGVEGQFEGDFELNEFGKVIVGFNYEGRSDLGTNGVSSGSWDYWEGADIGGGGRGLTSFESSDLFSTISIYSQYQLNLGLLSGLNLTAGFREDMTVAGGSHFAQFSPRLGVVQKFTDYLNLKLLYGSALRAPTVKEVSVNNEVKAKGITGVKDLDAETINSYEGSVNLVFPKISLSATGFYNKTSSKLDKVSFGSENIYINDNGHIIGKGFEANLAANPIKYMKLLAGYSYSKAYTVSNDSHDGEFEYGVPTSKLNGALMIMGNLEVPITLTPSFYYIFAYRNGGFVDNTDELIKSNNDNFYSIDVNATVQPFSNIGFEFMISNLTNNQSYQPGIKLLPNSDGTISNIDIQKAGTAAKIGVTVRF